MKELLVLYRGPLASCNLHCHYCPFATHQSSRDELDADRRALDRFVDWVRQHDKDWRLSIQLTPSGEALVQPWYRQALVELSHLDHVGKVAIQTNLCVPLDWLAEASREHLGLWVSHHPEHVPIRTLLARCRTLDRIGVRYSVGLVGLRRYLDLAARLRRTLPEHVYLWINAFHDGGSDYYEPEHLAGFAAIDPLFPITSQIHPSHGRACATGRDAIAVGGDGWVRRCWFVDQVLGNLYQQPLSSLLQTRPCPSRSCRCHIGMVHIERLGLRQVFGSGLPERIPQEPIWLPSVEQTV
jgi:MoaA/NifB/PqqE/SkfB family radical SAM enzyme